MAIEFGLARHREGVSPPYLPQSGTDRNRPVSFGLGLPAVIVNSLGPHADHSKAPCFEIDVVVPQPEQFFPPQSGIKQRGHHHLHLRILVKGLELFIDLRKRQEPNLGSSFLVPLDLAGRILIARHLHPPLPHRPAEQPVEDFPVSVSGLRGQPPAADLGGNEVGDLAGGDVLQVFDLDHLGLDSLVLLDLRPLLGPEAASACGDR